MPDIDAYSSRTPARHGNGTDPTHNGNGNDNRLIQIEDRRRPAAARFTFVPDPRMLRTLLHEIEIRLAHDDFRLQRKIRLLVGEIVARLLTTSAGDTIELAIEAKPDSVRIDIWDNTTEPSDFFAELDEAIFVDLASAWGQDRRRPCGAWFEVALPTGS